MSVLCLFPPACSFALRDLPLVPFPCVRHTPSRCISKFRNGIGQYYAPRQPYPTDPHDMTRQIPNDPGRAGRSVSRPSSQSLPVAALTLVFSIWAGITCFATVGMFSAVTNLGAGGTQDTALSDISNGVLYGMFSLTGLVSGGINNRAFSSLV